MYTLDPSSNNFSDLLDLFFFAAVVLLMMYLEKRSATKRRP